MSAAPQIVNGPATPATRPPYSADADVSALIAKLFQDQKNSIDDDRAAFKANQDRLDRMFPGKKGVAPGDPPPQVMAELVPILIQCPQIVPHVTLFARALVKSMAVAAGAQLQKSLAAIAIQLPPAAAPAPSPPAATPTP